MSNKYLVEKCCVLNGYSIYKGYYFDEKGRVFHPEITSMFDGVEFKMGKRLEVTKRFNPLGERYGLNEAVKKMNEHLENEMACFRKFKNMYIYYNMISSEVREALIKRALDNTYNGFMYQVGYYFEETGDVYNERIFEILKLKECYS